MKEHPLLSLTPITASDEVDLDRRLATLRKCTEAPAFEARTQLALLEEDFGELATPMRQRLLGTQLSWSDAEKESARWLHHACDGFAEIGYRLSESFLTEFGIEDGRTREVMARTLFYMGETVKWEACVAPQARHDYRKPHALMSVAMAGGHHRNPLSIRAYSGVAECTLESLYLRLLLLARFASGVLSCRQMEILDVWMGRHASLLRAVQVAPRGAALRVDLDSAQGLQRGPRSDTGPSLYLSQDPIEEAYGSLVAEFHAGSAMSAQEQFAGFGVEEQVAVLELIRRGVQTARSEYRERSVRKACDEQVELRVGLGEITAKPFHDARRDATAKLVLVNSDGRVPATRREAPVDDIYDAKRQIVRLVDHSQTGLGLECETSAPQTVVAGDLVAVKVSANEEPTVGIVVRSAPSKKRPGRMAVGVRKLTQGLDLVVVTRTLAGREREELQLAYVADSDVGGRNDAFLASERTFSEGGTMAARIGDTVYTFKLDRILERGRGWVLSGFRVIAALPTARAAQGAREKPPTP
jgi:hypothetical protein